LRVVPATYSGVKDDGVLASFSDYPVIQSTADFNPLRRKAKTQRHLTVDVKSASQPSALPDVELLLRVMTRFQDKH